MQQFQLSLLVLQQQAIQEAKQEASERLDLFMRGVSLLATNSSVKKCIRCKAMIAYEDQWYCEECGFPVTMLSFVEFFERHLVKKPSR